MIQVQRHNWILALLLICAWFTGTSAAHAQSQSLSVTPPLFQLSVSPGDAWQSSIKIINPNPYPLTISAEVTNFVATGESGHGRFIPIDNDPSDENTLAEWIDIVRAPQTIPAEQSQDISFLIHVPENAPPGGHYAAILISTQPENPSGGQIVQTVQSVTSLFFLRVEGDVQEVGTIRELRALDSFVSVPDVTLSLRFENKGNVHLQPKGDIIITNMWGTERGRIPVNYKSNFGNVLPQSIRDFTFLWKSNFKITDVGRYKVAATLAYGENGIQSTYAVAYFWVIPVKWTVITLTVLALFIALITFMVRAYIRRVLMLSGVGFDRSAHQNQSMSVKEQPIHRTYKQAAAPIAEGVLDLRNRLADREVQASRMTVYVDFILQYRVFFLSILALLVIIGSVTWYLNRATEQNQEYQVEVINTP